MSSFIIYNARFYLMTLVTGKNLRNRWDVIRMHKVFVNKDKFYHRILFSRLPGGRSTDFSTNSRSISRLHSYKLLKHFFKFSPSLSFSESSEITIFSSSNCSSLTSSLSSLRTSSKTSSTLKKASHFVWDFYIFLSETAVQQECRTEQIEARACPAW